MQTSAAATTSARAAVPLVTRTPGPVVIARAPAAPATPRITGAGSGAIVTVTNATDEVNGDTTNIAALTAAPGADGISFREAVVAANGTAGEKSIRFAASLKGAVIRQSRPGLLPPLTGGSLSIDGDIDGDGSPDVTLDGSLGSSLGIRSSGVSIARLRLVAMGITFGCADAACEPKTVGNIRLVGNVIEGRPIVVSPMGLIRAEQVAPLSGLVWEDIEITGNRITVGPEVDSALVLRAGNEGSSRSRISRVTISGNRLSGGRAGINLAASDVTSADHGGTSPIRYSDGNSVEDVTIADNVVSGASHQGIVLQTANAGNRDSRIARVLISGNRLERGPDYPIVLWAGEATETFVGDQPRSTSGNAITDVAIRSNVVEATNQSAILVAAAGKPSSNRPPAVSDNSVERVEIRDNTVTLRETAGAGIRVHGGAVYGPEAVLRNVVSDVAIVANRITADPDARALGIDVTGGRIAAGDGPAQQNEVRSVVVRDNVLSGTEIAVMLAGGRGPRATGNAVVGYAIERNDLGGAESRIVPDADGASGNSVR